MRPLRSCAICVLVQLIGSLASPVTAGFSPDGRVIDIQEVVDDLREQLSLPATVAVAIVPRDPLMVSVKAAQDRKDAFLLSIDVAFLELLDMSELRAVIAHELGHVWIFTHHPYLQTERLANDVAMRVVSRESLERVYAKVWQQGGTKGDLARFLGQ